MSWGVLVAGPPGSGKSTYCAAAAELLQRHHGRPCAIVNLDFANESPPAPAPAPGPGGAAVALDVSWLIRLEDVMAEHGLGPNGGLLFCMDHLEANADWLLDALRPLAEAGHYLIFDTPGQAELYSSHEGLARVVARMQRELGLQLASLHLVDSTLCASPFTFVAAALLSLQAMVRLELPHLNVLTKCDLRQAVEGADGAPSELSFAVCACAWRFLFAERAWKWKLCVARP
jgi:hypothetical protein